MSDKPVQHVEADDDGTHMAPRLAGLVKPNPNLPRTVRARVAGQMLDDVPAVKHQVGPERRFAMQRAEHGTPAHAALEDKAAVQDKLKELEKSHNTAKHAEVPAKGAGVNHQPGKTVISANNQLMDSRHRHGGESAGKHGMGGSRANAN